MSPSRVRAPSADLPVTVGLLTTRYGKGFDPADLYALPPERPAEDRREIARDWNERVRFEAVTRRTFASLAGPGGYAYGALVETWTELIERGRQLGLLTSTSQGPAASTWTTARSAAARSVTSTGRTSAWPPAARISVLSAPSASVSRAARTSGPQPLRVNAIVARLSGSAPLIDMPS